MSAVSFSAMGPVAASAASAADQPRPFSNYVVPNVMQGTIIPMIGNPALVGSVCKGWQALANGSYRFVLEAYGTNKRFTRFVVNIPRDLTDGQIKELVVNFLKNLPDDQIKKQVQLLFSGIKNAAAEYRSLQDLVAAPRKRLADYLRMPVAGFNKESMILIQNITDNSSFQQIYDAVNTELASLESQIDIVTKKLQDSTSNQPSNSNFRDHFAKVISFNNLTIKKNELERRIASSTQIFKDLIRARYAIDCLPYLSLIPKRAAPANSSSSSSSSAPASSSSSSSSSSKPTSSSSQAASSSSSSSSSSLSSSASAPSQAASS